MAAYRKAYQTKLDPSAVNYAKLTLTLILDS